MGSDLIALFIGIALAVVVVCSGWRRNLAEVTRSWLPRFEQAPKPEALTSEPLGSRQGRRELSPGERRFAIWFYLIASAVYAAVLVLSTRDRPIHAAMAVLFAISAVVLIRKKSPPSSTI